MAKWLVKQIDESRSMLAKLQTCASPVYDPRPRSYLDSPLTDRFNIVRPFHLGFRLT